MDTGLGLASGVALVLAVLSVVGGVLANALAVGLSSGALFLIIAFALNGVQQMWEDPNERLHHIRGLLKVIATRDMPDGAEKTAILDAGVSDKELKARRAREKAAKAR